MHAQEDTGDAGTSGTSGSCSQEESPEEGGIRANSGMVGTL